MGRMYDWVWEEALSIETRPATAEELTLPQTAKAHKEIYVVCLICQRDQQKARTSETVGPCHWRLNSHAST